MFFQDIEAAGCAALNTFIGSNPEPTDEAAEKAVRDWIDQMVEQDHLDDVTYLVAVERHDDQIIAVISDDDELTFVLYGDLPNG